MRKMLVFYGLPKRLSTKEKEKIKETLEKNKGDISNSELHNKLIKLAKIEG